MNTDHLRRAQASYEEEVAATWRDWCAYLRAQAALIAARAAATPGFDTEDSAASRADTARRRIALLAPERAQLFDAVFAERREQSQRDFERQQRDHTGRGAHVADPDASDAALLSGLLAEAEGRAPGAEPGWGLVPLGTPGTVQWFQVDLGNLNGPPDDAAYALGASDPQRRKRRQAALGGLALVILAAVFWLTIPDGASGGPTLRPPQVNGQPVTTWAVSAAVLSGAGDPVSVVLRPVSALPWPDAPAWLRGSSRPLQICLPAAQLAGLRTLRLTGEPDTPAREYAVTDGPPDLVVAACGGDAAPRSAQLRGSSSAPSHRIGESAALSAELRVTLVAAQQVSAAEDPNVPAGAALLALRVSGLPADVRSLAPTLRTPGGAALQPVEIAAHGAETELRYLLADGAPSTALWSVSYTGQEQRWQFAVPPATDRAARLAAALQITPHASRADGSVSIALVVQNRSDAPVQLSASDLLITQADARLSPEAQGLDAPIPPGGTITVTLRFPAAAALPIVLNVGAERYQLE